MVSPRLEVEKSGQGLHVVVHSGETLVSKLRLQLEFNKARQKF